MEWLIPKSITKCFHKMFVYQDMLQERKTSYQSINKITGTTILANVGHLKILLTGCYDVKNIFQQKQ